MEADVAVRSPAAVYTYSKTKGLFAGISIEGSALIERKDANKKCDIIIIQNSIIALNVTMVTGIIK